ncbi:MAG: zinc ribbon domain-containing protein [bacterium]
MKMQHCHSCAVPLGMPGVAGPVENYCKHCVDDDGKVKSRDTVFGYMKMWMKMWQPPMSDAELERRARDYMKAMPHWAED